MSIPCSNPYDFCEDSTLAYCVQYCTVEIVVQYCCSMEYTNATVNDEEQKEAHDEQILFRNYEYTFVRGETLP